MAKIAYWKRMGKLLRPTAMVDSTNPRRDPSRVNVHITKREVKGLKIAACFRILIFGVIFVANFWLVYDDSSLGRLAKILTQLVVAGGLLIWFYFFHELNQMRKLSIIGSIGCVFDCFILAAMPFIWYHSVGGEDAGVPRLFMLKSDSVRISSILLVLNAMSLRLIYPLVITVFSMGFQLFLFAYAYAETVSLGLFASSYLEVNLGNKIMFDAFFTNLFFFACTGLGITYITWTVRRTIYEAALAEKENLQISRYFSPAIATRIKSASLEFMKPGGNLQDVGILFSDIRNFTSISETMEPEETMRLLSSYHERMVKVIFDNHGTLDKFIGDGIMATFGTPDTGGKDAENTLNAALGMRQALAEFNDVRVSQGLPPLTAGIGIHFGKVVAGNIGTPERLEYTVIGDNVNIASRLESNCKELQVDLLCSKDLLSKLSPDQQSRILATYQGKISLKGKQQLIDVFTVHQAEVVPSVAVYG